MLHPQSRPWGWVRWATAQGPKNFRSAKFCSVNNYIHVYTLFFSKKKAIRWEYILNWAYVERLNGYSALFLIKREHFLYNISFWRTHCEFSARGPKISAPSLFILNITFNQLAGLLMSSPSINLYPWGNPHIQ